MFRTNYNQVKYKALIVGLKLVRIVANNKLVIQEIIKELSISEVSPLIVCSMEQGQSWQQPILEYLTIGKVPKEENEAKKVRRTPSLYTIVARELYHRGYS